MSLALLFAGQGAQKAGMGRTLYDGSASARAVYENADQVLGWAVSKVSFEGPETDLTQTKVCQPALFVQGLAALAALRERGQAREPAFARGRLMQLACEKTSGGMAAVIGEERPKVAELAGEFGVEVANFNAPGQIILSGEKTKIDALVTAAKERGLKRVMPLNVAGAYHSRLMEPARTGFAAFLQGVTFQAPKITVFSNTTGQPVRSPDEIREALVRQVVSSVLWEDCMRNCAAAGATEFIECGPGAVLAGMARRTEKSWVVKSVSEWADLAA
jgi:[acyl-carrier-protein] S-malonyltransferase